MVRVRVVEGVFTKECAPGGRGEVRDVGFGGTNSGKPVVKDHVVGGGDVTGAWVEHHGNRAEMLVGDADKLDAFTARLPLGELLAIGNGFIQQVDRTTPDMEIMQAALRKPSAGEEVKRGKSSGWVGDAIEHISCILVGEGPKGGIGHIRPVGSGVEQQCSRNGHERPYGTFRN
jgi:hypothetical protein